jgi:hypothetical protein
MPVSPSFGSGDSSPDIFLLCAGRMRDLQHTLWYSIGQEGFSPVLREPSTENGASKPPPLKVPEGTGGSGCSAEVEAKAEALRAALYKSSAGSAAGGSAHTSTDANPAAVECAVCRRKPGDPGVPATLKLCGGCKNARYCSTECQRKDWKIGHKAVCQVHQRTVQEYLEMLKDSKQQASRN